MLHISESDVSKLLSMPACIDQMRLAFEAIRDGETINQPRRRLILKTGSVLHQMAGSNGKYFVNKMYSSNLRHGGLHQMYVLLYDAETGKPLALIEANNLGSIRTGAATGYVADLVSNPEAEVVGLIGSGYQSRTQIEAVRAVREIKEVRVWSRTLESSQRFAAENNCVSVPSAEAAVQGASIVITATSAKDPVVESDWIAPGTFIAAMGSNVANRRELPAELVQSAKRVIVDDIEQARIEAGDLLLAYNGPDGWCNVEELKNVTRSYDEGRVTIFKSLGIAVEDAAAAGYVYEQAVAAGLSTQV